MKLKILHGALGELSALRDAVEQLQIDSVSIDNIGQISLLCREPDQGMGAEPFVQNVQVYASHGKNPTEVKPPSSIPGEPTGYETLAHAIVNGQTLLAVRWQYSV